MTQIVNISTFKTKRPFLRAPILAASHSYIDYKSSERSKFANGSLCLNKLVIYFAVITNKWLLHGYKIFMTTKKTALVIIVSRIHLIFSQEQSKLIRHHYDTKLESKNYMTKAMSVIITWAWTFIGLGTENSHTHDGNDAPDAFATRLGATFDPESTRITNAPGEKLAGEDVCINVWRHHKRALT